MEFKGKKALVYGLARSGVGAANLLSSAGAEVAVTDSRTRAELSEYISQLLPGIRLEPGTHAADMEGTDLIVVSPGVPLDVEPIKRARSRGIKIIGELELAYQMLNSHQLKGCTKETKFLAVTGTNGKSTTTTLLGLMLRKSGIAAMVGGNIGNALTGEICKIMALAPQSGINDKLLPDYIVAEVSSFQLESIADFKPKAAAILNITPDHLDRYRSVEEYGDAKARIFLNQDKDDFLVLNADDPETERLYASRCRKRDSEMPAVYFFSRQREVEGAYLKDGVIRFRMPEVASSFTLHPSSFLIKGVHNLENAMAASAMALLAGCTEESVADALNEFPGLEHRMEYVREIRGVRYINDSKGTNVGAVAKSLDGFSEPVILIAGGRDKAGDFAKLRPFVKGKVKEIILIGEAAVKIRKALGDLASTVTVSDLKEAVFAARDAAQSGDVVLLSPACASFDMFRDFEDRGRQFKDIVRGLV